MKRMDKSQNCTGIILTGAFFVWNYVEFHPGNSLTVITEAFEKCFQSVTTKTLKNQKT